MFFILQPQGFKPELQREEAEQPSNFETLLSISIRPLSQTIPRVTPRRQIRIGLAKMKTGRPSVSAFTKVKLIPEISQVKLGQLHRETKPPRKGWRFENSYFCTFDRSFVFDPAGRGRTMDGQSLCPKLRRLSLTGSSQFARARSALHIFLQGLSRQPQRRRNSKSIWQVE